MHKQMRMHASNMKTNSMDMDLFNYFFYFYPQITKQRNTSMCVRLSSGGQFSVKVRAKPDGSIYSGHWSDWSDVLLGTTTDNTGKSEIIIKNIKVKKKKAF